MTVGETPARNQSSSSLAVLSDLPFVRISEDATKHRHRLENDLNSWKSRTNWLIGSWLFLWFLFGWPYFQRLPTSVLGFVSTSIGSDIRLPVLDLVVTPAAMSLDGIIIGILGYMPLAVLDAVLNARIQKKARSISSEVRNVGTDIEQLRDIEQFSRSEWQTTLHKASETLLAIAEAHFDELDSEAMARIRHSYRKMVGEELAGFGVSSESVEDLYDVVHESCLADGRNKLLLSFPTDPSGRRHFRRFGNEVELKSTLLVPTLRTARVLRAVAHLSRYPIGIPGLTKLADRAVDEMKNLFLLYEGTVTNHVPKFTRAEMLVRCHSPIAHVVTRCLIGWEEVGRSRTP